MKINQGKSIGKVLFIVEGAKTEFYILRKIFTQIFDYQVEELPRNKPYKKYNSKTNAFSSVFVVNAEESNIQFISDENEFLNQVIAKLRFEYKFPIDNAAIYYVFDRDGYSNTNPGFIRNLLGMLRHAREDNGFLTSGLLLLSYPAVESFTLSNFCSSDHEKWFATGAQLKHYNDGARINHQNINDNTIIKAAQEMMSTLKELAVEKVDLDNFYEANNQVFDMQEGYFAEKELYRVLSFLCVALLDLGLIEMNEE